MGNEGGARVICFAFLFAFPPPWNWKQLTWRQRERSLHQRKQALYTSLDEAFDIGKEAYRGQQYSQIYSARLHMLRTLLYSPVPLWKPHSHVCNILGLEKGKECVIVGTLYKDMKLKSTILDEYSKERSVVPLVKPHNFMHPDDHLILEDESGRVKLGDTKLAPSVYVTGVVAALLGKETDAGDFLVLDVLEAGLPPQIEPLLESREAKYVVFVSGLSIGTRKSNPLEIQLLVDHITGHLGDEKEQGIASKIVHAVIAGNSVEIAGRILAPKEQSRLLEPVKELDILLTQIAAGVPLDIMPGPNEPAHFSLPQQPLNRCLFPGSAAYNSFRSCINPHCFELDNIRFLGTPGQNIADLAKYSDAKDELEFMERTSNWRLPHRIHWVATHTLIKTFPDRELPACLFCWQSGQIRNTSNYGYLTEIYAPKNCETILGSEGQLVRLISIPRFSETGIAVVQNMKNLECHTQFRDRTQLLKTKRIHRSECRDHHRTPPERLQVESQL